MQHKSNKKLSLSLNPLSVVRPAASIGCQQNLKCLNTFCISRDLACDAVNHCGDNSDETSHAFCFSPDEATQVIVLGLDANLFIGLVLSVFIVCLVCVVNLAICLCRREQTLQNQQQSQQLRHPGQQVQSYVNGIHLNGTSTTSLAHPASYTGALGNAILTPASQARYATLPLGGKGQNGGLVIDKPPPYPGNMFAPASGHHNGQPMQLVGQQQAGQMHAVAQLSNGHSGGTTVTLLGPVAVGQQGQQPGNGVVHPVQQVVYYSTK